MRPVQKVRGKYKYINIILKIDDNLTNHLLLRIAPTILKSSKLGGMQLKEAANEELKGVLTLSCIIITFIILIKHKESILQNKKKSVPTLLT